MPIRGKDGADYANVDEVMKANARWEQQQKQNKLLEEQNRLLKEQQRQQEEQNRTIQLQQEYERLEVEREKQEQEHQKWKDARKEYFAEQFSDFIAPLMIESGIKDPIAYYEKLLKLYEKPNGSNELDFIDENNYKTISEEEIQKYPLEIQNKIKNLKLTKSSSKILLLGFAISAIVALIGVIAESEIILISAIFPLSIGGFINSIKSNSKKEKMMIEQKIKENIKVINIEIEKYNQDIKNDNAEWEDKIRKFESRRLENFSFPLELALERLTFAKMLSATTVEELDYIKQFKFTLQFNEYPKDWETKRKQYYDSQNKERAKEEGTEIFEDLL